MSTYAQTKTKSVAFYAVYSLGLYLVIGRVGTQLRGNSYYTWKERWMVNWGVCSSSVDKPT